MLDGEFSKVQEKVKQTIDKADCIAVISDGWSNLRGQGIINFIISTPRPVFYKSTDTKDNRHTGPYIADELKAVINDLGPKKVFTLVTDNAANMKAAWANVVETYPHITPIGCAAHALNLLLKDIVALKTMDTLFKRANRLVRYVKGKQVASAIYLSKQTDKNKRGWGCHHVQQFTTALPTSLLLQAEETAVVNSMEKRKEFCIKPVHAAAYMLGPKRYEKSILSGEEINQAYTVSIILQIPPTSAASDETGHCLATRTQKFATGSPMQGSKNWWPSGQT